jgi:DNA adenine methylase
MSEINQTDIISAINQLNNNNINIRDCVKKDTNSLKDNLKDLAETLSKLDSNLDELINLTITNKSPLRYPGGKTRACKILESVILKYFDVNQHSTLYSPFFGGGSFEFHLQNKFNFDIVCNDKFKPLYTFWNVCKNNKKKLCEKLYLKKNVTKEEFSNIRTLILNENNYLLQAYYYFIVNRCSFSGATLSGGFSEEASKKRFTKTSVDRINNLNLSKFVIYNEDFTSFINYKCLSGLIFLDPPYYLEKQSKLYGNNGDMHENFNHDLLYDTLKNKKYWIMTYNNCEFIRNLYKDFTIIEVNWVYGMNKSKKSSEIVILNNN